VSLRDLILGRKRRIREGLEGGDTEATRLTRAALAPDDPAAPAEAAPEAAPEAGVPAGADSRGSGPEAGKGRKVVLRRVRSMTVPGALVSDMRRQAVLDRLFIVLDPNEVLISGGDRVARLTVANQRLMLAQFSQVSAPDLTFDFRPGLHSEDLALGFVQALTGFCAAPVDLMISEQPVTGVFAGFSGLPVDAISFDEAEFRSTLQQMLSHPDHDHAGLGPAPDDAEDPAPKPAPLILSVPEVEAPETVTPKTVTPETVTPEVVAPEPASGEPAPQSPVPARPVALAFLEGCRSIAEDVRIHSRAGPEAVAGLRGTDSYGELPAAEALERWRQAVAPVLGGGLVAVLIPADRTEPMVALALDGGDAVAFNFGKQALGTLCSAAVQTVQGP
jgi:hypothetical protein